MARRSQILANLKYREKAYDRIAIDVQKGKRGRYRQEAEKRGLSLAKLIQLSVEEYITNHPTVEK